jgi:hypothetical protein
MEQLPTGFATFALGISGIGFSLWGFGLARNKMLDDLVSARPNPRRLKPTPHFVLGVSPCDGLGIPVICCACNYESISLGLAHTVVPHWVVALAWEQGGEGSHAGAKFRD